MRLLQSSEMDHIADAVRVVTQGIIRLVRLYPEAMRKIRSVQSCGVKNLEFKSGSQKYRRSVYLWKDYAIKLFK